MSGGSENTTSDITRTSRRPRPFESTAGVDAQRNANGGGEQKRRAGEAGRVQGPLGEKLANRARVQQRRAEVEPHGPG